MSCHRGTVMETTGRWAVVLTPDGEFRRVRVPPACAVGDEVDLPAPAGLLRPALVAAVLVLALATGWYLQWARLGPVVAYLAVDINPSVELGLDRRWRVVTAEPLNEAGRVLLEGLAYRGQDVTAVVSALTAPALATGSSQEGYAVLITATAAPGQERREQALAAVLESLQAVLPGAAQVQALQVPTELREEGRKLGLSAGRMAVMVEAAGKGVNLDPEELAQAPLGEAVSKHGLDLAELTERAGRQADWREEIKRFVEERGRGLQPPGLPVQPGVPSDPGRPVTPGPADPGPPVRPGPQTPPDTPGPPGAGPAAPGAGTPDTPGPPGAGAVTPGAGKPDTPGPPELRLPGLPHPGPSSPDDTEEPAPGGPARPGLPIPDLPGRVGPETSAPERASPAPGTPGPPGGETARPVPVAPGREQGKR